MNISITKQFPDIYFLPEWGKLFQEHDRGEICVFEFKNKLGHIYYQFIKRPVPYSYLGKTYFDTVTTYGFNGPIILEFDSKTKERLLMDFDEAFQKYCVNQCIISEYVRFNPWLKNHLDFEKIYLIKYNNYTLFTDLTVHDFFTDEFSCKVRNQIRKARKSGIKIEFDYMGVSINEFQRLYQKMTEKNNVSEYYLFDTAFLVNSFKTLENKQFIINALFEDKYISSAIFLHYGNYIHYHLSANDPQYYPLCANSLILYEGCNWGLNHGKLQMHLGGAFSEELFRFKRKFTKNGICDYYIGKKIRNLEIYNELVKIKLQNDAIINKDYFPLYRG
jgi:hypothetical protein